MQYIVSITIVIIVALFNYQSRKSDPAILPIVATSKGCDQKLLFNDNGVKADLKEPMTAEEKQLFTTIKLKT